MTLQSPHRMDQFCTTTTEFHNIYVHTLYAHILMYLIIPCIFVLALLLFSQSLKMIKIDRNMSELSQIVCKQYTFNISVFVGVIV